MKEIAETTAWTQHYRAALHRYMRSGPSAKPPAALRLGRRAVTLGMEILDVVRIHEQTVEALSALDSSSGNLQETTKRAQAFFAETIVPIEKTHHAALVANVRVSRLTRMLRQRTLAAEETNRELKEAVRRRQSAEAALRKSESRQTRRLSEAQRLQKRLRRMMRDILSAHENERRETSRHLQDEVSQSLLGIHISLLALKTAAEANSESLQKRIDETRELVVKCKSTLKGRMHNSEGNHET